VINSSLVKAIKSAYQAGEEDENLDPIVAVDKNNHPLGRIKKGDSVIFYDIRGEREIELTRALTERNFKHFPVVPDLDLRFVTMIEYHPSLKAKVAFPSPGEIKNTLTEVVTKSGLKVLKIAESEKAVHVGFFMNGKNNKIFPGEERIIIDSPSGIPTYNLQPEMSAKEVAVSLSLKIKDPSYSLIIANFANVDVVGHTGDRQAVLKAVETVDFQLGKVIEACRQEGVTLIVTSDHGTVEEWFYEDGSINTGHTKNPVPFILADYANFGSKKWLLKERGELADVTPTIINLLNLNQPSEITGKTLLLNSQEEAHTQRRVVLLILDGWGLKEKGPGNLLYVARTPYFDKLWSEFPHCQLQASGEAVGMPAHTVGNSEAGHLHLGAGRRVFLDRVRIDKAIEDGLFFQNTAFLWAMEGAKKEKKSLHLLGIVSHYSSHGTIKHLYQLLRLAQQIGINKVFVHALIGRRGEKPESGAVYVNKVEQMCRELTVGQVVTVMGRFWALDREENWDRVEKAYRALVLGEGKKVPVKDF